MPRNKGQKKKTNSDGIFTNKVDFTINDCANADKPVGRVKKSTSEIISEKSWEELNDDDLDLVEETNSDGTKSIISRKKINHSNCRDLNSTEGAGIMYPEIVWYHISSYIKPEAVGSFARINRSTYTITKRESFWRNLYLRYCRNQAALPENLRMEHCHKVYGLRQKVIRALYYTYNIFKKVVSNTFYNRIPKDLEKQLCVNVWYKKSLVTWHIFMKFKKCSYQRATVNEIDIIEELGRVDANPEEGCTVLQIISHNVYRVPPLMGMTLLEAKTVFTPEIRQQKLFLGFHTSHYNVTSKLVPECYVVIDSVTVTRIFDWWHPLYPHSDDYVPSFTNDEESLPVLKKDFFATCNGIA